jgi:hypothetical protein
MSCRTNLGNLCLLTAFAFSLSCGARLFAQPEPTAPVVIELNDEYFDPETGILKVHVTLQNQQNIPIYLVANQWTFLKGAPGSNFHRLTVQRQKDRLIFDLSHLPVTERFWNAIHEVGEASWYYSQTIKIRPHRSHHFVLAFQFPLQLSSELSDVDTVNVPAHPVKVQFRFGWAREDLEDFVQKELLPKTSPAKNKSSKVTARQAYQHNQKRLKLEEKRILTEWQRTVLSAPVMVDLTHAND